MDSASCLHVLRDHRGEVTALANIESSRGFPDSRRARRQCGLLKLLGLPREVRFLYVYEKPYGEKPPKNSSSGDNDTASPTASLVDLERVLIKAGGGVVAARA